jgi:hypothetical protein
MAVLGTRAGLLCEALRRLAEQRSPCDHGQDARATMARGTGPRANQFGGAKNRTLHCWELREIGGEYRMTNIEC